jgi:hypothetical protein
VRSLSSPLVVLIAGAIVPLGMGCADDSVSRLTATGKFVPSSVDFGDVAVGSADPGHPMVLLENTGDLTFTIDSTEVPDGFAISGENHLQGLTLAPGDKTGFELSFVATAPGPYEGTLIMHSGNLAFTLDVRGNLFVKVSPLITSTPTMLAFGTVVPGTDSQQNLELDNSGNAEGTIQTITLRSTGAPPGANDDYGISEAPPFTLAVLGSQIFAVVFHPVTEGVKDDALLIAVAGGDTLTVPLHGEAWKPQGMISCTPSVDFGQLPRGENASASVSCTVENGPVQLDGVRLPPGTTLFSLDALPAPAQLDVGATFSFTVDFAPVGLPEKVRSAVTVAFTTDGQQQITSVALVGEVLMPPISQTVIALVLRWDTDHNDLDVHLTRYGEVPFTADGNDCYFDNMSPNWSSATPPDPSYDPYLDRDVTTGYGPEHLNMSRAEPNTYDVWVHYYAAHGVGASTASIDVYLSGQPVGTYQATLNCNDMWHVGGIRWSGESGTFTPDTAITAATEGDCG